MNFRVKRIKSNVFSFQITLFLPHMCVCGWGGSSCIYIPLQPIFTYQLSGHVWEGVFNSLLHDPCSCSIFPFEVVVLYILVNQSVKYISYRSGGVPSLQVGFNLGSLKKFNHQFCYEQWWDNRFSTLQYYKLCNLKQTQYSWLETCFCATISLNLIIHILLIKIQSITLYSPNLNLN